MGVSVVILVAVFVVFLGALLRWGMKCDEGCYLRQFEPGRHHPWTRYRGLAERRLDRLVFRDPASPLKRQAMARRSVLVLE